ncbi:hypothetical protein GCM10010342_47880 [Streptomyces anulatus]|nr:hypothetical protein GCM10010342_47880 [Streptomyces anulatus]
MREAPTQWGLGVNLSSCTWESLTAAAPDARPDSRPRARNEMEADEGAVGLIHLAQVPPKGNLGHM